MLLFDKLTDAEGTFLVKLARRAIEEYVINGRRLSIPENFPPILKSKAGVFVTINKLINGKEELRGCIGYILPIKPLIEATIDVAISAATQDPRFPPIRSEELDDIVVEVTVLTPPEEIRVSDPIEYLEKIKIGRDGLILEYGMFSGTLLPQVPVEYGWDVREFLDHLCIKAGLPFGCWKERSVKIYAYRGIIWKEKEPRGEIVRIELTPKKRK